MSETTLYGYTCEQLQNLITRARSLEDNDAVSELQGLLTRLVESFLTGVPVPPGHSSVEFQKFLALEIVQELLCHIVWPRSDGRYAFDIGKMDSVDSLRAWVRECVRRWRRRQGSERRVKRFTDLKRDDNDDDTEPPSVSLVDPKSRHPVEAIEPDPPARYVSIMGCLFDITQWAARRLASKKSLAQEWVVRYWLYVRLRLYQLLCRHEEKTVRRPLILRLAERYIPWDPAVENVPLARDWPTLGMCWQGFARRAERQETYAQTCLIETVYDHRAAQEPFSATDEEAVKRAIRNQWDQWCSRLRRHLKEAVSGVCPWHEPDDTQRQAMELWHAVAFGVPERATE